MNLGKNYYALLGVARDAEEKQIKKAYYKLSFIHHTDKKGDAVFFAELTEAYDVLCSKERSDYDLKSKFGNNYNEYFELFNINSELEYDDVKSKREKFDESFDSWASECMESWHSIMICIVEVLSTSHECPDLQ